MDAADNEATLWFVSRMFPTGSWSECLVLRLWSHFDDCGAFRIEGLEHRSKSLG